MNERVLYLECNSGISGDMTVAALLDLGADRQILADALASLPLSGYSIEIQDVFKSGIRACDFCVKLDHDNHDHDMEYLRGHEAGPAPQHPGQEMDSLPHHHGQEADLALHHHDQETESLLHHHSHEARNLQDITAIIQAGRLTETACGLALRIFRILAEAEASVHGKSIDEVHFHEVGAVDSIVDIVAAAVCLDNLHPEHIVVSPLTDGTGQIRCQHGRIPVPVPAVTAIAAQNGLVMRLSDIEGELVTPTGAAIAAALRSDEKLPEKFRILKVGFGAGKRSYAASGLLRAMLLEPAMTSAEPANTILDASRTPGELCGCDGRDLFQTALDASCAPEAPILSLETNIDDCSGEALAFTMQKLLEHGALDVFCTPIYMKKNRPATLLRTLCRPRDRAILESIIFKNTTTIGIRVHEMQRTCLPRRIVAVETPWGVADVKCCSFGDETFYYPENDSVCALAEANQTGFPEMYHLVQEYARKALKAQEQI